MNEAFKKGVMVGMALNPLYVGEGSTPTEPEKEKFYGISELQNHIVDELSLNETITAEVR